MRSIYRKIEYLFEHLTEIALKVYGNSLTFIIAFILVIIYLLNKKFYLQDFHDAIRDVILCITFLSFFIIQKSFNKYNTVMQLKMNELVAAHDKASNRMVNIEQKTEEELNELAKHYSDLAEIAIQAEDIHEAQSIETIIKKIDQLKDDNEAES